MIVAEANWLPLFLWISIPVVIGVAALLFISRSLTKREK